LNKKKRIKNKIGVLGTEDMNCEISGVYIIDLYCVCEESLATIRKPQNSLST
jgi:hypothetical protein